MALTHKKRFNLWMLAILLMGLFGVGEQPAQAQARLSPQSRIQIDGIGPVQVGMTLAEAEQVTGLRLITTEQGPGPTSCRYAHPENNSLDIAFMVIEDVIARVDIGHDSPILTLSGAGVGDTEAQILALYPNQIEISPHPYGRGGDSHYLTFIPRDQADQNYRVIFETSEGKVTEYRAGRLPEIRLIEGCS
ncbi:MAG: hypothetical protein AAGF01_12605 [Cyanobacteria bacterium P01_G01_bin.38]